MFWLLVIAPMIVFLWHDCSQYRLSPHVATHSPLCRVRDVEVELKPRGALASNPQSGR
jgi:hypothetical protein